MARDGTKSGGRPKGSLNKKTIDLFAKCEAKGIDPFDVLLELAASPEDSIRIKAATELCGYLYAKKRSIDLKVDVEQELIERAAAIKELPSDVLKKLAK